MESIEHLGDVKGMPYTDHVLLPAIFAADAERREFAFEHA